MTTKGFRVSADSGFCVSAAGGLLVSVAAAAVGVAGAGACVVRACHGMPAEKPQPPSRRAAAISAGPERQCVIADDLRKRPLQRQADCGDAAAPAIRALLSWRAAA